MTYKFSWWAPHRGPRNVHQPCRLGPVVALLRPCATSAGFLATQEHPWHLDMARLKRDVASAGYHIVVDAKVILIVRRDDGHGPVESSLYDNGRVLLKTTDKAAAEAGYAGLEPLLSAARRS